jgi:hypothetical protein
VLLKATAREIGRRRRLSASTTAERVIVTFAWLSYTETGPTEINLRPGSPWGRDTAPPGFGEAEHRHQARALVILITQTARNHSCRPRSERYPSATLEKPPGRRARVAPAGGGRPDAMAFLRFRPTLCPALAAALASQPTVKPDIVLALGGQRPAPSRRQRDNQTVSVSPAPEWRCETA